MGGWDHAGLKREQMDDNDMEPILQIVKAGECPKWEASADCSPIHKVYWAQQNSQVVRDVLGLHWESADGRSKTAKIVLPHSNLKEVLDQLHG